MRWLILSTCLLYVNIAFSQNNTNLISNSSFEDTITTNHYVNYPVGIEQIIPPWFSSVYSPDFFSPGGWINGRCIPSNSYGFQYPNEGVCYAGFSVYVYNTHNYASFNKNYREWIGQKLESPLKKNMIYNYEFYLSKPDRGNFSSTEIGMYFSHDSINMGQTYPDNGYPLSNSFFPYPDSSMYLAVSADNVFLTDTVNWIKISGQYIGKGGEQYIYIGHFKPDSLIDLSYYEFPIEATSNNYAYYYIDNVSLIETGDHVGVNDPPIDIIDIYPNPAKDFISIELPKNLNHAQLSIFNLTGQLIFQKQINQPNQQIPITELGNGMYIFVIQNDDRVIGRQRVVVAR